jgi:hypothetical protein
MKKKLGTIIDESLLRQMKRRAAEESRPLASLIEEAVSAYLAESPKPSEQRLAAYRVFCEQPIGLTDRQFQHVLESDPWDS